MPVAPGLSLELVFAELWGSADAASPALSNVGRPVRLFPRFTIQRSEQRAIAAFLDRETAKIDGLVARKERLIELLQEKRTALITRAVTRGLDPNVPMKDSGVEWLGEIPAHWEVKKLGYVTNIGNGIDTKSKRSAMRIG